MEPHKKKRVAEYLQPSDNIGDSGRTRTPNLLIRSQLLYPVELRNLRRAVVPDLAGLVQYRPEAPVHRSIKDIAPLHHWSHAGEPLVKDPVKWNAHARTHRHKIVLNQPQKNAKLSLNFTS